MYAEYILENSSGIRHRMNIRASSRPESQLLLNKTTEPLTTPVTVSHYQDMRQYDISKSMEPHWVLQARWHLSNMKLFWLTGYSSQIKLL